MEIKSEIIWIPLIILGIILLLNFAGDTYEKSIDDWPIPGSSCESDNECIDLIMDCISHYGPDYSWNGNIKCMANKCYCMTE